MAEKRRFVFKRRFAFSLRKKKRVVINLMAGGEMKRYISYTVILCLAFMLSNCMKGEKTSTPTPGEAKKGYQIQLRDKFYDTCFLDAKNIWVVGQYGIALHSVDEGVTWELQESKTVEYLYSVDFVDKDNGWIAGSFGTVLHTSDGGKNWETQVSKTENNLFAVDFTDKENGWAVGFYGTILHTKDGGKTWESQSIGEDVTLNSVTFIDPGRGWIAGEFGTILHTATGGKEWKKQAPPKDTTLFGIHFADAKNGYAVGLVGTIFKTTDGGKTWNLMKSGTEHTLYSITKAGNFLFSAGDKGTLVKSPLETGGKECIEVPLKTEQWLYGIAFSPEEPLSACMVGGQGTILYTKDGGATWVSRGLTFNM